jgi:hypothetical protein
LAALVLTARLSRHYRRSRTSAGSAAPPQRRCTYRYIGDPTFPRPRTRPGRRGVFDKHTELLRPCSSDRHARNSGRWSPIRGRPGRPAPFRARRPGSTGEGEPPMLRTVPRRPDGSATSYVVVRVSRGLGDGREGGAEAGGRAGAAAGAAAGVAGVAGAGPAGVASKVCRRSRQTRSRRNRSRSANSTVVKVASAVVSDDDISTHAAYSPSSRAVAAVSSTSVFCRSLYRAPVVRCGVQIWAGLLFVCCFPSCSPFVTGSG